MGKAGDDALAWLLARYGGGADLCNCGRAYAAGPGVQGRLCGHGCGASQGIAIERVAFFAMIDLSALDEARAALDPGRSRTGRTPVAHAEGTRSADRILAEMRGRGWRVAGAEERTRPGDATLHRWSLKRERDGRILSVEGLGISDADALEACDRQAKDAGL